MTTNIWEYRQAIEDLAKGRIRFAFPNEGDDHALVVFENIFENAEKQVSIIAGSLCGEFTAKDSYMASVKKFLKKPGSKLRLLINNAEEIRNSAFFKSIKDFDNVSLRSTTKVFSINDYHAVHFCVGDDRMYRFEYDIENRKATCNFNNKKLSKKLRKVFDKLFKTSEAVCLKDMNFA